MNTNIAFRTAACLDTICEGEPERINELLSLEGSEEQLADRLFKLHWEIEEDWFLPVLSSVELAEHARDLGLEHDEKPKRVWEAYIAREVATVDYIAMARMLTSPAGCRGSNEC